MDFFDILQRIIRRPRSSASGKVELREPGVVLTQKDLNITEGSEFLDDGIRMKEQPFMYTEESMAPGSPEGLW